MWVIWFIICILWGTNCRIVFLNQFVFALIEPEWITNRRPSFVLFFSFWYFLKHTGKINLDHTQIERTELEFTVLDKTLRYIYTHTHTHTYVWTCIYIYSYQVSENQNHCLIPVPIVECVLVILYSRVWCLFLSPCLMLMFHFRVCLL